MKLVLFSITHLFPSLESQAEVVLDHLDSCTSISSPFVRQDFILQGGSLWFKSRDPSILQLDPETDASQLSKSSEGKIAIPDAAVGTKRKTQDPDDEAPAKKLEVACAHGSIRML